MRLDILTAKIEPIINMPEPSEAMKKAFVGQLTIDDTQQPLIDSMIKAMDTMPQNFMLHEGYSYYPLISLQYVHSMGFNNGYKLALKDHLKGLSHTAILNEIVMAIDREGPAAKGWENINLICDKARREIAKTKIMGVEI